MVLSFVINIMTLKIPLINYNKKHHGEQESKVGGNSGSPKKQHKSQLLNDDDDYTQLNGHVSAKDK